MFLFSGVTLPSSSEDGDVEAAGGKDNDAFSTDSERHDYLTSSTSASHGM